MMKNIDINQLLRENIKNLKPYSSARNEYSGKDAIFLDANENPHNAPYNRYPDPLQLKVKSQIAEIKQITPDSMFLGNGSDEAIDLLIRAFCRPGKDNILYIDPTYGMYKVCADINDVPVIKVLLTNDFQLDVEHMLNSVNRFTKMIFICSPNNPTSNSFREKDISAIIENFNGLVVLDEAYIDFSQKESFLKKLDQYQNLVILQTFSKAWALAGIRLGMCFAHPSIISVLNKIKYPYNVNQLTLAIALDALLLNEHQRTSWIKEILSERDRLSRELLQFPDVLHIYPSDANFLLVKFKHPRKLYEYLKTKKIIVRDRSKASLCEGCLRLTVGTSEENDILIRAMKESDATGS